MNDWSTDTLFHISQLIVLLIAVGSLYGIFRAKLDINGSKLDIIEKRQVNVLQRLSRLEGHFHVQATDIDAPEE